MATPMASGRPNNLVVPTFVLTFSTPIPSLAFPSSSTMVHAAFPSSAAGASSLAQFPVLHQPFVVGHGFSPVPAILVSQIVAGKFVELHELLPANIVITEPEPQLLFDGCLVLTSSPKKPKRRIEDISTWLETSIYCLVLISHFPNRWKDLLQYQLLILRRHCQFADRVWLSYDRAFRENATATNLTDWSQLNSTLFSFHSAGWSARSPRDAMLCSQVCQLPRPAPHWSLPCRNAQRAELVIETSSRLSALSVQQQVLSCVDSPPLPSGRTFLRRMINLLCCFRRIDHPVQLNQEFHLDLRWWHQFLAEWHGISFWLFPGLLLEADVKVSTDAAGSLGYGAYMKGQ